MARKKNWEAQSGRRYESSVGPFSIVITTGIMIVISVVITIVVENFNYVPNYDSNYVRNYDRDFGRNYDRKLPSRAFVRRNISS